MLRSVVQRSFVAAVRRPLVPAVRRVVPVRFSSTVAHEEETSIFNKDYPEILTGPYGTREKPVVVPSVFSERIVGCVGASKEHEHILLWHTVRADKPTICFECGQTFLLKQIQDEHHHHDEAHGEHGKDAHGKDAHGKDAHGAAAHGKDAHGKEAHGHAAEAKAAEPKAAAKAAEAPKATGPKATEPKAAEAKKPHH